MRLKIIVFFFTLFFILNSCDTPPEGNDKEITNAAVKNPDNSIISDTMPRVTGIGGVFFRSKNPAEMRHWYGKNLGLVIDEHGSPFEFRNAVNPEQVNYLRWSPFEEESEYFKPSVKDFMINYRVNNIEGLVSKLRKNGVKIVDTIQVYEYGKFVHIMDAEGNKIELWEPVDSYFIRLGTATTK